MRILNIAVFAAALLLNLKSSPRLLKPNALERSVSSKQTT